MGGSMSQGSPDPSSPVPNPISLMPPTLLLLLGPLSLTIHPLRPSLPRGGVRCHPHEQLVLGFLWECRIGPRCQLPS